MCTNSNEATTSENNLWTHFGLSSQAEIAAKSALMFCHVLRTSSPERQNNLAPVLLSSCLSGSLLLGKCLVSFLLLPFPVACVSLRWQVLAPFVGIFIPFSREGRYALDDLLHLSLFFVRIRFLICVVPLRSHLGLVF